jgi:regulator of sigma E protease
MHGTASFLEHLLNRLSTMGLYAVVAVLIGFLILIHELGHFFVARKTGMRIEELSIGMGKELFTTVRNGIRYSLRVLPFFGYVKITGMGLLDDDHPEGFNSRPFLARVATLAGGGVANMAFAVVLFVVIGCVYGKVVDSTSEIDTVFAGRPAAKVGLLRGDRIVGIDGVRTTDVEKIRKDIEDRPGKPVTLQIQRAGRRLEVTVVAAAEQGVAVGEDGKVTRKSIGRIGIGFHPVREPMGVVESLKTGFLRSGLEIANWGYALWLTLRGHSVIQLVGPVGMVNEMGSEAKGGAAAIPNLLSMWAMISLTLGVLNLIIPFPALDGGRLAFLFLTPVVEFIRRKKVNRKVELWVHAAGIAVLLLMIVVVTIRDVVNWH